MLGEKTFEQVPGEKLFWQANGGSNSIAMIVQHLHGNMLSRWTDFLTSDGEKEWRRRDEELDNDIQSQPELLAKWEEGWNCLFAAIEPLTENDLEKVVYIRNMGHSVVEAINRQLAHYWLESNGEAVYQTEAGPPEKRNPNIGMVTTRSNTLYLHVTHWPDDGRIYFTGLREKSETGRKVIQEAYLLNNPNERFSTREHQDGLTIFLNGAPPDPINSVVVVKYE